MQWGSEVCSAPGWLDPPFPDHLMGGQGHLTQYQDTNERGPLALPRKENNPCPPGRQDTRPAAAKAMPEIGPGGKFNVQDAAMAKEGEALAFSPGAGICE